MSLWDAIKNNPLFHDLQDHEIDVILDKSHVQNLNEGQHLFEEGDDGEEIFIVLTGSIEIEREGTHLATLRRGDLLGELVLFKESDRNANAYAGTYSTVLVIRSEDILALFKTEPQLFALFIYNLARKLTKRLIKSGQEIGRLKKSLDEKKRAA